MPRRSREPEGSADAARCDAGAGAGGGRRPPRADADGRLQDGRAPVVGGEAPGAGVDDHLVG
ncbi:MAG TPA: hypothetical protein VHG90_09260, partial [Acidimicrobiales bacterium]|nr:hypothetical protein [Acidimicrobiales bacterium]